MNLSGASLNDERHSHAFPCWRRARRGQTVHRDYESVALHDLENTQRFIDKVRITGRRSRSTILAPDTRLSYLKELRADTLKIDGNFILG